MWILMANVLAAPTATAGPTGCPAIAPATWGGGKKVLQSVRVVSYPVGTALGSDREYYATPPWEEREKAGYILQTWHINSDNNEFKYEVDCVYEGTQRYISLEIVGKRQCVARWRARRDHGVVPHSLNFYCL